MLDTVVFLKCLVLYLIDSPSVKDFLEQGNVGVPIGGTQLRRQAECRRSPVQLFGN